jgi:hypothetical protein
MNGDKKNEKWYSDFGNRNEPDTRFQLLCGFAGSGVGKRDGCWKVYDGTDGAENTAHGNLKREVY